MNYCITVVGTTITFRRVIRKRVINLLMGGKLGRELLICSWANNKVDFIQ